MSQRWLPYLLLAMLAGVVSYALIDTYQRGLTAGLREAQASQVQARVQVVQRTDTLYVRDTIRFARWRDRWDSIRLTDTLWRDSVVYVPRQVADSVISACQQVIWSCEQRVVARDSLITSLQAALKLEQDKAPSTARVLLDRALWAAAGAGVASLLRR